MDFLKKVRKNSIFSSKRLFFRICFKKSKFFLLTVLEMTCKHMPADKIKSCWYKCGLSFSIGGLVQNLWPFPTSHRQPDLPTSRMTRKSTRKDKKTGYGKKKQIDINSENWRQISRNLLPKSPHVNNCWYVSLFSPHFILKSLPRQFNMPTLIELCLLFKL